MNIYCKTFFKHISCNQRGDKVQIKKDEVRLKILEVAADEFLKRGYENASMRIIAQKAHTTQGNIYHYFQSKEILLEEILLPTIENIECMMSKHIEGEKANLMTKEQALKEMKEIEHDFDRSKLGCFFDKKVIILLKLESSHLLARKEKILYSLTEHLQEYFNINDDSHYSEIVLNMLIECVKHVLIEHENLNDAKAEFFKFFNVLFNGIISQIR
nr:TetR/AcrR family transcriptional regulator [Murimonas intestini]